MELVKRLREVYESGYRTARLETVREWTPKYDREQLSRINRDLDELRQPYREGSFLERIVYTAGWKKGQKDKMRSHWIMANI